MKNVKRKIWIDLDNTPHVPFFKPIITELTNKGFDVLVTARDCFQVCSLADMYGLSYQRIGRHYGKNKVVKLLGLLLRSMQLAPLILREKPDLALSHGSRSQVILSKLLGISSVVIFDYEHAKGLFFAYPDSVIVPELIPDSAVKLHCKYLGKYPGIKEDVYVPSFIPRDDILQKLGIDPDEIVITVRPPATEAHYHKPQSDELFSEAIERFSTHPGARIVLLPRNDHQAAAIEQKWPWLFSSRKIIIPDKVVDGLNLIWHSDLVVSGGGTMNREAAALGVPVYSIFRGETGLVDKFLASCGRLTLLENTGDVNSKIRIEKWHRPSELTLTERPALQQIVNQIQGLLVNC